jgi:hypothetical protein
MFKKGKAMPVQKKARAPRSIEPDADDKRGTKNRASSLDGDGDDMSRILNGGNRNARKKK